MKRALFICCSQCALSIKTCMLVVVLWSVFSSPQTKAERRALDIYFIDVEGGAATLIVTPAGESVLMDAGWDGFDGRDARRIQQAMRQAGVNAIDHLLTSHYHRDHYGAVPELSRLVTIRRFYDHGPMAALDEDPQFAQRYAAYQATHHGGNLSNNPVLLRSLRPTVTVMINGPRKGAHPDTIRWLRETPSFKALYQLHRNVQISEEQNAPAEFIANPDERPDEAKMITVSVDVRKRVFSVTNE